MRNYTSESFNRNLTSIWAAALLLLTALMMSGDASLARTVRVKSLAGGSSVVPASQRERLETELVTITSVGFEPTELTRPAGKFLLDVDNRSEIEEVVLRLDRQDGDRETSARVRNTAPEWRGALYLRPGVYILSEANHPNWTCRITLYSN